MKTVKLPCYNIRVKLSRDGESGTITSDLNLSYTKDDTPPGFLDAVNGLESMILACACAGIEIQSPAFLEAIETTVDAINNNYDFN